MISVSHLVKRYGRHTAVDDVSFTVDRGEVVGFLGPNGAGKSTTLRIVAGALGMTGGTVTIAGHDVVEDPDGARAALGYMPEAVPLYPEMRVVEYLRFRAELKGVPSALRRGHVDDAMGRAKVSGVATMLIGKLSKGFRQRVGLADTLVARPPILVLDEPTAGLDPNQILEVRALVRDLGREHTLIVSTHVLSEVEAMCSRTLLLAKGKLVAQGTVEEMRALRKATGVTVVVRGEEPRVRAILEGVEGVAAVAVVAEGDGPLRGRVLWREGLAAAAMAAATEAAVERLVEHGIAVREVTPLSGTLDEVFAALTTGPAPKEGAAP